MSDSVASNNKNPALTTWLAALHPALKTCWTDYFSGSQAIISASSPAGWLELLNTAALRPWDVPDQLARFLNSPQSSADFQHSWELLAQLFNLTFEAAQTVTPAFNGEAWQNLLQTQNCILKHAADVTLIRPSRPNTSTLARRALFLQTVTNLYKKIDSLANPAQLLDELLTIIRQDLGYENVSLFAADQRRQMLTLQSAIWGTQRPTSKHEITIPINRQGVIGRAAATGQAVIIQDKTQQVDFTAHPRMPQSRVQLAAPVIIGKKLIGVLHLSSRHPHTFSAHDEQIALALGSQLALIVENVRRQNAIERYQKAATLLYQSMLALQASPNLGDIFHLMPRKIAEAVDAGACAICLINTDNQTITAVAEYIFRYPGNPPQLWRRLNSTIPLTQDPIARQVVKMRRPVIGRIPVDTSGPIPLWALNSPFSTADKKQKPGWGLVLALPLETENQLIGILEIYHKSHTHQFSSQEVDLARILAIQTSIAMEQARLLNETRQRLTQVATLYTMAREITGQLNLQTALDNIVVTLRQAVDCRGCCIFLLDNSGQYLEIKAADGLKPQWREQARLRLGQGSAGRAAIEARSVYIPDTRQESDFIFFDEEVRSLLVIPMIAQGKVIGTINIDDDHPHAFSKEEEGLLTIAAAQAAIVIANARLFAQISAEQKQTQAIIQYMADGLLLINSEGDIITCNHTLAAMLGLHTGQIIGQNINAPNLIPNLAGVTTAATQSARTGVLAKEVIIKKPRPRTLQVFATTVLDNNQHPIGEVRVIHDITKERELEQLKDNFFSTISHELRTPLFSIQGFAKVLLEEKQLDSDTRAEFLGTIQRQAAQLGEMVNNLLDFSRFDNGKIELERQPVTMADLIYQTVLKLQGFAHQQKVQLVSDIVSSLPAIMGDRQRLEQVLTNLIGNAIKFSHPNGQVTISATVTKTQMQVSVQDNGIGIAPEELDQIFSPYYQADSGGKRSAMGSGLGLYIARKVIQEHNGRIWAESPTQSGSVFYFTLPLG